MSIFKMDRLSKKKDLRLGKDNDSHVEETKVIDHANEGVKLVSLSEKYNLYTKVELNYDLHYGQNTWNLMKYVKGTFDEIIDNMTEKEFNKRMDTLSEEMIHYMHEKQLDLESKSVHY